MGTLAKFAAKEFAKQFNKGIRLGTKVVSKNVQSTDPMKSAAARKMLDLALKLGRLKVFLEKDAVSSGGKPDRSAARSLAERYELLLFEIGSKAAESRSGKEFVVSNAFIKKIDSASSFGQKVFSELVEAKLARLIKRGKRAKTKRKRGR